MSNVLIGVGGSGQHIVHAYLQMLALGNAGERQTPHVYIIDADAQSQQIQNRRSQLIPDIKNLHAYLGRRGMGDKITKTYFDIIRPYSYHSATNNGLTVENVLLSDQKNSVKEIKAFFYDQDLEIKVSEGMHANPKIGSTIFGEKLGRILDNAGKVNTADKTLLQKEFSSLFDDDVTGINTDKCNIVIVGSVFGGTGSGIIPTLARTFDEILKNSNAGHAVRLSTVATLPWFQLESGEDGQTGSAFDVSRLKRNTAFALRNFQYELQSNNNAVSSIFIQSGNQWADIKRPSAGDFDQPEHTHVVNLLAANAVQHALSGDFAPNQLYMPMSQLRPEVTQGHFHPYSSQHLRFKCFSQSGKSTSLWMLMVKNILTVSVLQAFIEVLSSYHEGKFDHPILGDSATQYGAVKTLLEEIRKNFGLALESKSKWLGMKSVTFVPPAIVANLKDALMAQKSQYENQLRWLYQHDYGEQSASGIVPDFRAYHGITGSANANSLWSQLVGANEQTGFEADELWQSCALKALESTIHGNANTIDTTLQAKINTVVNLAATETEKYALLASDIARYVFEKLDKYVKAEEMFGDRFKDAQTQLDSAQSISRVQLQMQQQQGNIAHYGTMDWDLQLAGDVARLNIMDIEHPKTLYWLDALHPTAITSNVIHRVQLDERISQGVPNILAPFLLQKWRLGIQNDVTVAQVLQNRDTTYYEIAAKKFHSTQSGLYLYAQRVVEAAFWLLISGDTGVAYKVITLDDGSAYHRWLKRELMTQGWADSKIGMITAKDEQSTPLFLWNGYYWCLAANTKAEDCFTNLLQTMQLPSLRYRYIDLFTRDTQGNNDKVTSVDKFFTTQLTRLKDRLANRPSAAINANDTLLLTALKGILTDLPQPAALVQPGVDPSQAVETIHPPLELGARHTEILSEIGTSKSIVQTSRYLLDNTRVIMLDKLPNDGGNVLTIEQFLPVIKDYWVQPQILDRLAAKDSNIAHTRIKFDNNSNNECVLQYTTLYVPNLGWMDFKHSAKGGQSVIAITSYDLAFGVGIWPNFKADNWTYYFVSADVEKRSVYQDLANKLRTTLGADELFLTIYDVTLSKSQTFGFDAIPAKIDFVPAVVELSCDGVIIGTHPITLDDNLGSKLSHIKSIGLDFGTSNTCMAVTYQDQSGMTRDNINLANTEEEPRLEWLIYSEVDDDKGREDWLKNRSAYYLQRQANVSLDRSFAIPSELLLGLSNRTNPDGSHQAHSQLKSLTQKAATSNNLIHNITVEKPIFTPLCSDYYGFSNSHDEHIEFFRSLLNLTDIQRIYDNIKWPQNTEGAKYEVSRKLRAVYIEQILIGALVRLRAQGLQTIDYLYVTRPDAFMFENTTFAGNYSQAVGQILQDLMQQTGITLTSPNVVEVSETDAALEMSRIGTNESYVVVDMGGGTTDIDIGLRFLHKDSEVEVKYSSSIKWAGNNLLSALLQAPQSPVRQTLANALGNNAADEDSKHYEVLLSSLLKLRIRSGERVIDNLDGDPAPVTKVAKMFFESIYEYIFVKIKLLLQQAGCTSVALLKNKKINIVLQGNGFKLSDYFSHDNQPHKQAKLNKGHYAPEVWDVVFAEDLSRNEVGLKVTYGENSKEHMIRSGAGTIAEKMYTNQISNQLASPKVLYPAKMFDKNDSLQPILVDYQREDATPKLIDELTDKEALLPVLEYLFPYTKRYWRDTDALTYSFISHNYGEKSFYDVNAMYLTGTGSGADHWNFYMAMTDMLNNH